MSKEQLVEYWAKGTVNGKKFQITTPDAYDHKQIHKQNPHLSADEAKAVADHTYTDDFEGGRESSRSTQGGHKVHVHSHGGYSDENDTEAQELFKNVRKESIDQLDDIIEAIDQLDELSKETLGKYIKKATSDAESGVAAHAYDAGREDESGNYKRGDKANARAAKRVGGIEKAVDRLTKESIESMISAILDGDGETAQSAFNQAIGEKITNSMDAMKIEIAGSLGKE